MEENTYFEEPPQFSLCVRVRERLPDLLEGYLDAMAAEAIRAHLAVCFLCAKEYNEMQITVRLVETLPFVEPEQDFSHAIMTAVQRQSDHSFQTPVVEMETSTPLRFSRWPRTTTGRQRPLFRKWKLFALAA